MNEQLAGLINALEKETAAKAVQTAALNRLAESNEALVAVILHSLEGDEEFAEASPAYLSGKPKQ